jgi:hypothetical protein
MRARADSPLNREGAQTDCAYTGSMKTIQLSSAAILCLLTPPISADRVVNAGPSRDANRATAARTKGVATPSTPGPLQIEHTEEVATRLGLTAIEYGHIEKDEDERLIENIRSANNIKILVSNGYNLVNNFKNEFTDFLAKPGSSMQVLFATADSDFYREETEITLGLKPGEEAYNKNLGLVALDRGRLEGYATPKNIDHLQFRYFDTQFRLPIIIIDNRYCYMTIRLSPNEASQSLRMEFDRGYSASCVAHFDRMWSLSSPNAESSRILAFFGLASWSRTELMALVACVGTLLAGVGSFLAAPVIQRFLRLERRLEEAVLTTAPVEVASSSSSVEQNDANDPAAGNTPRRRKRKNRH